MVSAQAAGKQGGPALVAEPPIIQCPEACYLHFKAYLEQLGAGPGQVRNEVGGDCHHLVLCGRRSAGFDGKNAFDDSARLILNDRAAGIGCAHHDRRDRKSSRVLCAAPRCYLIIQWIDYATGYVSIGPLERLIVEHGVATRASESLDAHSPPHTIRCYCMTSSAIDQPLATALWPLVDALAQMGGGFYCEPGLSVGKLTLALDVECIGVRNRQEFRTSRAVSTSVGFPNPGFRIPIHAHRETHL